MPSSGRPGPGRSGSPSGVAEAARGVLQVVCDGLDWDVGAFWVVDRRAGVVRCVDVWHPPAVAGSEFVAVTRQSAFPRGVGLPGRVWDRQEPVWVVDFAR